MNAPACRSKWKVEPLGQAVEILDSRRVPVNGEERKKRVGKIPYYGATGQVGWINDYLFDEELVLLGEDGAPFLDSSKPKAYLIRGKSWVNNHAHVLRAKPGLLNSFLLYQLNCTDYGPYVSGTTRLKLPQGPMKQIPLLIPDEDEQREIIAEIEKQFTRLEAGVAALRRVQANLKRYRATVLKAACEGKLVPTQAELARQEGCTYETGAQLLERILAERRQKSNGKGKYKEPVKPDTTNLPPLPEGWTWSSTDQLSVQITDGEHIQPRYQSSGRPMLSAKNVRDGFVDFQDKDFISESDFSTCLKRCAPTENDILIVSVGATTGRTAIVGKCEPFAIVRSVLLIRPISNPRYMLRWLQSPYCQTVIQRASGSTAQAHLYIKDTRMLPVPLAPLAEQRHIVAEVERRLSVVEEIEAVVNTNLQRVTRLRQSILQRAFEGKLVHTATTETSNILQHYPMVDAPFTYGGTK